MAKAKEVRMTSSKTSGSFSSSRREKEMTKVKNKDTKISCKTRGISKRREAKEKNKYVPYLCKDIIWNIVCRLPVKSLAKLKSVCKAWFNIISDPVFNQQYFLHSEPGLIIQELTLIKRRLRASFLEKKEEEIHEQSFDACRMGNIMACCNGLVIMREEQDPRVLRVTNPATKQQEILPPCTSQSYDSEIHYYGFAFVASTLEYKVLHLFAYDRDLSVQCEILTLGTDNLQWRRVDGPSAELGNWYYCAPVSINGVLHWSAPPEHIISMDMGKEKFHLMQIPKFRLSEVELLDLGGSLSFVNHGSAKQLEVWVSKDLYGKKWVHHDSFTCAKEIRVYGKPIASSRDGNVIIFSVKGSLCAYDIKLKQWVKIRNRTQSFFYGTHAHINSLAYWKTYGEI